MKDILISIFPDWISNLEGALRIYLFLFFWKHRRRVLKDLSEILASPDTFFCAIFIAIGLWVNWNSIFIIKVLINAMKCFQIVIEWCIVTLIINVYEYQKNIFYFVTIRKQKILAVVSVIFLIYGMFEGQKFLLKMIDLDNIKKSITLYTFIKNVTIKNIIYYILIQISIKSIIYEIMATIFNYYLDFTLKSYNIEKKLKTSTSFFILFVIIAVLLASNEFPVYEKQKMEFEAKKREEAKFLEQLKWAEEGDAFFQDIIGYAYYEGRRVKKDYVKAVYWFKKSAAQGYCEGRYDLAFMYYNGYGVQKDYKQAAYWYEKSYEKVPMPKAQYNLGNMYLAGEGVKRSISKALELYESAANAKYSVASKKLGDMYFKGENGIKLSYEKAIFWYSKAADDGKDREIMCFLGNIYYEGKAVKRDYKKAREWYSKSANFKYIPAIQKLADIYYNGKGVSQDYQKAFSLHREVAMSSFFRIAGRSMLIIGDMYSNGLGVEKNYQEALKWYKRAAAPTPSSTLEIQNEARSKFYRLEEQLKPGNNKRRAESDYNLANKFFAKKDYNKAVQLYELAAELGHFKAKQKVEEIYSKGLVDRKRKSSELHINQVTKEFNAFITGDKVNIRAKPTTSSSVVTQFNAGYPVKTTKQTKAKDGTWYFIQTASGNQGWVFGKYVKLR